jgi:glycosyltransferase involved in cell wall biosynthesis
MNNRKDIVLCAPYFHHGGAEKQFRMLVKLLLESKKYNIDLFVMAEILDKEDWLASAIEQGSLKINCFGIDPLNTNKLLTLWCSIQILLKVIFRRKSILYFYSLYFLPLVIAKIFNPSLKMYYSERILSNRVKANRQLYKLFKVIDGVVVNSTPALNYFKAFIPKTILIENFVEPIEYIKDVSCEKRIKSIAVISRISAEKNIEYILEAFKGSIVKVNLYFTGEDITYSKNIRAKYSRYKNISFLGNQKLTNIYENNDCLVHSSKFEGTPNVVIEAMASNYPCFVSNIEEHLSVGISSEFIFDISEPHALNKKIEKWEFLADGARGDLLQKNRAKSDKFSLSQYRNALIELFS